jgi:hypothetical protein
MYKKMPYNVVVVIVVVVVVERGQMSAHCIWSCISIKNGVLLLGFFVIFVVWLMGEGGLLLRF